MQKQNHVVSVTAGSVQNVRGSCRCFWYRASTSARASTSILGLSVPPLICWFHAHDAHMVHVPEGRSFTEKMFRCNICGRTEKESTLEDDERAPLIQQTQLTASRPMLADG